jgi:molybdate transport system substrate-binding protein
MKSLMQKLVAVLLLPIVLCAASAYADDAHPPVVVFAAASLKNALDDAVSAWEHDSGQRAVASYAASNALAKQIEHGAPADLFISADHDWMQYLSDRGLTQKVTERDLLGNRLVLIAPKTSGVKLHIAPGFPLLAALGNGRLAICDLSVPAGKYAAAALQSLNVWTGVAPRAAQAENVRAALALVAHQEAPLGIVYVTDAAAEPAVRVVDTFPEDTHPPIVYPIALLRDSKNAAARDLLAFLESAKARPYFEKQGFIRK